MTKYEIQKLEAEFNLRFPQIYVDVLLNYPLSLPQDCLTDEYDELRQSNSYIRKNGFWEVEIPQNYWFIGGDGSGGGYFIACDAEETTVYCFDHESIPIDMYDFEQLGCIPFLEYIQDLVHDEGQTLEEELEYRRKLAIAVRQRKWWQFWVPKTLECLDDLPGPNKM